MVIRWRAWPRQLPPHNDRRNPRRGFQFPSLLRSSAPPDSGITLNPQPATDIGHALWLFCWIDKVVNKFLYTILSPRNRRGCQSTWLRSKHLSIDYYLSDRKKLPKVEAGRLQRGIENYIYLEDIFARRDTCSNSPLWTTVVSPRQTAIYVMYPID